LAAPSPATPAPAPAEELFTPPPEEEDFNIAQYNEVRCKGTACYRLFFVKHSVADPDRNVSIRIRIQVNFPIRILIPVKIQKKFKG
jgi:hypothetical protein